MPRITTRFIASGLLFGVQLLVTSPAGAARLPDFTPSFPIERQTEARFQEQPVSPYAMNYTDEAARNLGFTNGRADFIDSGRSDSAFVPTLKGGIDHGGAMLRLQWHPGE